MPLGHRRFTIPFSLVYQTPPETLASIPDMLRAVVEAHDKASFVRCGLTAFAPSSLDFELQFDVHVIDFEQAFEARHLICLDIVKVFKEAGITFAYPTQTSFTAAPDGSFVLPYAEPKNDQEDTK